MTGVGAELLRALGAVADNQRDARVAAEALGFGVPDAAEHTEVFVLNCPPYASIHLGSGGGIGAEAADRVAGFWRAIGLEAPPEPDHLSALLALYANLGEERDGAARSRSVAAIDRARSALFWEHLWSWVPNYLDAVSDLGTPSLGVWAALARVALEREASSQAGSDLLPAALRDAPPPLQGDDVGRLVDGLVTPIRSGFVITRRSLARIARTAGTGYRIGERRFALRAMLEQDPAATLAGLAGEAALWSARQSRRTAGDVSSRWWAQRSDRVAAALAQAGAAASGRHSGPKPVAPRAATR